MGNGISHAAPPSKDKANLVDEGHAGQFHKVLVEPDYSVPGPPVVKEDPHNTATLKIGTKPDLHVVDINETDNSTTEDKKAKPLDDGFYSADRDYAIIEDDGTALIIETTEKSEPLENSVGKDYATEESKHDAISGTENTYDDNNIPLLNDVEESAKDEKDKHSLVENADTSEKAPLAEEPDAKCKKEPVKKESKSLLNMFKFSKHKPKVVAEFVPDVSEKKVQNDKSSAIDVKHAKNIAESELIDKLKETSVDGDEQLSLIVDKGTDLLIQKQDKKHAAKGNDMNKEILSGTEKSVSSAISQDTAGEMKIPLNVERVNSLDSGIVVDKVIENSNGETDSDKSNLIIGDSKKTSVSTGTAVSDLKNPESNAKVGQPKKYDSSGKETNETEDLTVVSYNEKDKGVKKKIETLTEDVVFKTHKENKVKSSNTNTGKSVQNGEVDGLESYEPLDIPGQEIRYSPLEEETEDKSADTPKTKKKSWSFQFGGSKKNVNSSEKINSSTTSVDKIPSSSVKKKSKSIWGKLSFRKSTDDVSMATNGEVLYENEKSEKPGSKKKTKLKKIKAKKEKKGSLKKTTEDDEKSEAFNGIDIHLSEGTNTPRSRKSIVEEETPQTDAFDGASLSDLSLDGDVQVSHNPKGRETHDSPFAKELKTSLAKRAEKLSSVSDNEQESSCEVKAPSASVHPVAVKVKSTVEKVVAKVAGENKGQQEDVKTQIAAEAAKLSNKKKSEKEEPQSEKVGEYAHIVTEAVDINIPVQDIEYANLHALPEVEPVLEEAIDSKENLESDIIHDKESEKDKSEIKESVQEDIETGKQAKENESDTNNSVECVKEDIDRANTVNKNLEVKLENDVNSNSNVSEEDVVTPEKSKTLSSAIKDTDTGSLKQEDISPVVSDNHDDSDAYVHLVQLVQDYRDDNFDKHLNSKNNTLVTGTNSVMINLVPVSKDSKTVSDQDEVNSSSNSTSESNKQEKQSSATKTRRVIIMKEIGIQAPDIHIPMDIENDFGCNVKHGEFIDIGVQVSDHDFDDSDCVKKECKDNLISPSGNIEPAFF